MNFKVYENTSDLIKLFEQSNTSISSKSMGLFTNCVSKAEKQDIDILHRKSIIYRNKSSRAKQFLRLNADCRFCLNSSDAVKYVITIFGS